MAENVLDRAGEAALYRGAAAVLAPGHVGRRAAAIGRSPRCSSTSRSRSSASTARSARSRTCASIAGTALSLGWVEDGHLVCAYHGWTYDPDGVCTRIPASHGTNIPSKARIVALPRGRARRPDLGLPRRRRARDAAARLPRVGRRRRIGRSRSRSTTGTAARRGGSRTSSTSATSRGSTRASSATGRSPRSRTTTSSGTRRRCRSSSGSRSRRTPSRATPATPGRIQRTPSRYTISMPFSVHLDQPLEDGHHFVLFVASCPLSAKETRNFTWNARNYELDPAPTRASSTSSR